VRCQSRFNGKYDGGAILEFVRSIDAAEDKFGPAVIGDLEIGWFDEIEVVAIPQISFDNPLSTSKLAGDRAGHGTAQSAWGRTRLSGTAVKLKARRSEAG
jgi:hypothetical protein